MQSGLANVPEHLTFEELGPFLARPIHPRHVVEDVARELAAPSSGPIEDLLLRVNRNKTTKVDT